MQQKGSPPPAGVIFDTSLSRSEHVLALATLYKLQSTREARVASLSVSQPGLRTAAFCDALARFLSGSGARNAAPIGIPARGAQTANAMAEAVLGVRTPEDEPRYPHGIKKMNDTADVAALIRNGISTQQPDNGVVVVAGPLSNVAAAMALPDVAPLALKRVRTLVIAATTEDLRADLPSARKVFADWPTPLVLVEAPELTFPSAELESRFAWSPNHVVPVAYGAFQKMPYDAPLGSAAAAWYAIRPESDLFAVGESGVIDVTDDGRTRYTIGKGTRRILRPETNRRAAAGQALVELITAQPQQPAGGRGKGKQA